mgnify:CR=1 FL=1
MILKRVVENYTQTQENNLVFKVNNTFAKDSVRVTVAGVQVQHSELGTNIIRLLEAVPLGALVSISYETQVSSYDSDIDIVQRLRDLEKRCTNLEKQNEILLEAIQQRVPAKTFRQWLLVMEKNFGKSVLDSNSLMGIQGESIPNEWKI